MKKTLYGFGILTLLIVGIVWFLNFAIHNGQFTKWSHTSLVKGLFEDGKAYYLDYLFRWEGFGNPTLQKVEFIKTNGDILAKDDDHFRIESYISNQQRGSFDEESAINEGITDALIPVKGYKVKDEFSLALIAELLDQETDIDIATVRITYKKFGKTQFQNIPFDEGLISKE
ncbi:hypothetical protein [Bacillus sp. FJAT-27251]|uniref:hypothetical protein n=1 Tax=Bacillus sp. FJAT-27251 TaxID=1684142 RepID=UPI0006A7AC02|nr:hypothetical protein [Bacillus sp. FJAT-27251]